MLSYQVLQINIWNNFETFAKIEVNGENASDLYKFLKSEAPQAEEDESSKLL